MTSSGFATPRGLGARFEINARFARTDPGFVAADDGATQLPTAHFIAARPAEGWIAALAIVTVATEPAPAPEWLAGHIARAQASFAQWSPEAAEMLVPPEAAELAGRPAVHVRYRLTGLAPEGGAPDAGPIPPSLVSTGRCWSPSAVGCWRWNSWSSLRSAGTTSARR